LACVAPAASAQLAIQRPTEKIAVLPLAAAPADSAASLQTADVARSRLENLAKYKVFVLPKDKYCEVLESSGYKCTELLDEDESRTLARTLTLDAYTQGRLERQGSQYRAQMRVIDIGQSGFARAFSVDNAATPQALGEAIAQRLNQVIRAGESARECNDQRSRGQLQRAVNAANKALQADPDLTGAHMCLILTYEAMRMPPDTLIAVANRALKGDPQNTAVLSTLAGAYLQKHDTTSAMQARFRQWQADRNNKPILLGLIQMKRLRRDPEAVALIDSGLARFPGDEQLSDMRITMCIEGELPCAVDALADQAKRDPTRLRDTAFVKVGIANAQKHQRPDECRTFAAGATAAAPSSATFWKARGACFEIATMLDSALWAYRRAADLDRTDLAGSLLVAKTIIESAQYDTARAKAFGRDSAGLAAYRRTFAARLDTARTYLQPAIRSTDTTMQLNAAALMRTAGEKLVRAGAIEPAYQWLDQTLQVVGPRKPGENGSSGGLRDAVRVNTSFWYGLASIPALPGMYQSLSKRKDAGRCDEAKEFNDRVVRTREALQIGRSVHEPTVQRYLETIKKFEPAIASVRTAFKCKNF
jgi:tetratricopeptide (TPR) repeat protein